MKSSKKALRSDVSAADICRRGLLGERAVGVVVGLQEGPRARGRSLLLLFFPGILEQGASSYARATGQTQEPLLERWLLLSAAIFGLSAIAYAARLVIRLR